METAFYVLVPIFLMMLSFLCPPHFSTCYFFHTICGPHVTEGVNLKLGCTLFHICLRNHTALRSHEHSEVDLTCQAYTWPLILKIHVSVFIKEILEAESGPPKQHPHSSDTSGKNFFYLVERFVNFSSFLWTLVYAYTHVHVIYIYMKQVHTYMHILCRDK